MSSLSKTPAVRVLCLSFLSDRCTDSHHFRIFLLSFLLSPRSPRVDLYCNYTNPKTPLKLIESSFREASAGLDPERLNPKPQTPDPYEKP